MNQTRPLVAPSESAARKAPPAPVVDNERVVGHPLASVVAIVDPQVQRGLKRLRRRVHTLAAGGSDLPFDPEAVENLAWANLQDSLIALLGRPVVLALHVARLKGRLRGNTSEQRFRAFLEQLSDPMAAADLMDEYPVLARQVGLCVDQWVAATGEFLERLCDDWGDIRATFSPRACPGVLVGMAMGSGDKHRQGRSVIVASFSSGFRLVYKPRSLAVDNHFQELLTWVNARGALAPFRTLTIIDRGTYGWVEFVHHEGCSSVRGISRFYQRQGGYLAILYALCAVDFHYENLIAAGEHPVLVDLEALFHPELLDPGQGADAMLLGSVLRVGLLPFRVLPEGKSEGLDVSGLGAVEGALWPWEMPHWENPGTDTMRLTRATIAGVSGAQHRPLLNGVAADLAGHAPDVAAGFASVYEVLLRHSDELLAEGGAVARFASDEVRVIVRPTQSYGLLLHASLHPDVLRDAGDRERVFDKLWARAEAVPVVGRVVSAERDDLDQGDIPLFTTRPCTRDLWTSRGDRRPDVLEASPLELVTRRLRRLGPADLARQQWFIQASFASLASSVEANDRRIVATSRPTPQGAGSDARPSRDQLLALACAIGDRLGELACCREENPSWIGLTPSREDRWTSASLGPSLYDGLPGVALFLAYLGAAVKENRFTDLAKGTLATMRGRRELDRALMIGTGALQGWGGVVYALAHIGTLWESDAILAEADSIAEHLESLIERDDALDLFGGSAGCLMALLTLHNTVPSERTLHAAVRCGRRLLAGAKAMNEGIAWTSPGVSHTPLSGLSHGAAGIALALYELWVVTGSEPFRTAALDGLTYERSLFSADEGNCARPSALSLSPPRPLTTRDKGLSPRCAMVRRASVSLGCGCFSMATTVLSDRRSKSRSRPPSGTDGAAITHSATATLETSSCCSKPASPGRRALGRRARKGKRRGGRRHRAQGMALRQPRRDRVTRADDRPRRDRLRAPAPGRSGSDPVSARSRPANGRGRACAAPSASMSVIRSLSCGDAPAACPLSCR